MSPLGGHGRKESASRQIVDWTFDSRGRAQVRVREDGGDGLRTERVLTLQMSEVPGAPAAFERLRSLLEPRLEGVAPEDSKRTG